MSQLKEEALFAREAEQSIIALLFAGGEDASEAFARMSLVLKPEDFFFGHYRAVYEAYRELDGRGTTPDSVMLATYLKSSTSFTPELRDAITEAASLPYALENVSAYVDAIVEKAQARRLKRELEAVHAKLRHVGGELSAKDLLAQVDAIAFNFEERGDRIQLLEEPRHLLTKAVERLEHLQAGDLYGARTGLDDLDRQLGPLTEGQLIVVAGRPSMGKTALALDIIGANNVRGVREGEEPPIAAFFSLEMADQQLAFRLLSNIGSIDHDRLRKGALSDVEWPKLTYAFEKYEKSNIRVDCDPTLTPATMRSKLRLLVRATKRRLGVVVVDYLQLMDADAGRRYDNRNAEVTAISRNLKKIAKEFGVPVVALSQLNRGVELRTDKRPKMSDLRESGAIEQDADIILMLYRDEYYNPDSDAKGIAEIIVAKARDGGVGTVAVQFRGDHQRFANLNRASYSYEGKYGDE